MIIYKRIRDLEKSYEEVETFCVDHYKEIRFLLRVLFVNLHAIHIVGLNKNPFDGIIKIKETYGIIIWKGHLYACFCHNNKNIIKI